MLSLLSTPFEPFSSLFLYLKHSSLCPLLSSSTHLPAVPQTGPAVHQVGVFTHDITLSLPSLSDFFSYFGCRFKYQRVHALTPSLILTLKHVPLVDASHIFTFFYLLSASLYLNGRDYIIFIHYYIPRSYVYLKFKKHILIINCKLR